MPVQRHDHGASPRQSKGVQQAMQKVEECVATFSTRWIPDAFPIAAGLTFIVFVAALALTDSTAVQLIDARYDGFWNLLSFAMQMVLIVITGYGLATATATVVQRGLRWLADRPQTASGAIITCFLTTGMLAFLHWGVALVIGAFLAGAVAYSSRRRKLGAHFPLIVAAAYGGLAISQTGLSSSAALLVNTPGHFLEDSIGLLPLSQTIFQPYALIFVVLVLITGPLLMASLHPPKDQIIEISGDDMAKPSEPSVTTPAEGFANSRILAGLIVAGGLFYVARYVSASGFTAISTPMTFPVWSMISAAIVHMAVPSAGGQWAVQGPIATEAVQQLGLRDHIAGMTAMMGDQLTNLIQPFWLLPLLGITGLKVGQVLGYTAILMVLAFTLCAGCLLVLI
ncbi:TIGR00366 family protein [Paracoccus sp. Z330]|uniref:TIGR00366 family protein n=1 Tax=Paracoccus onchidii TaxID=3017813 RepID=A0ABT4ZGN1_9RHOB|nr:TIGR00366 family protein [Paracoccus onchidii]MDB6178467.1 TIGR00366 family protein [Paracoccus onchidii]